MFGVHNALIYMSQCSFIVLSWWPFCGLSWKCLYFKGQFIWNYNSRLDFIMILNTGLILLSLTLKDLAVKIRTLTQFAFKHLDLVQGKNLLKLYGNYEKQGIYWKFSINFMEILDDNDFFSFRQCLGKNLYILESKVMLIHLLRNFRWNKKWEYFLLRVYFWIKELKIMLAQIEERATLYFSNIHKS